MSWDLIAYAAAFGLLARFGRPANWTTWTVLSLAALVNLTFEPYWWDGPLVLGFACLLDGATAVAIAKLSVNHTATAQIAILSAMWGFHVALFVDLALGTNFIYDTYETLIGAAMFVQLLVGYDDFKNVFVRSLRRPKRFSVDLVGL